MKNALVTTTINIPHNLEAYAKDIAEHGPAETRIIVAGDQKTPIECELFLADLVKQYQIPIEYLTPRLQTKFLIENGAEDYEQFLSWNCIQRRNVAILKAYKEGAEIIATIDDDNYWEGEGYFLQHGPLGSQETLAPQYTENGWFNPCSTQRFYPRGYSFKERGTETYGARSRVGVQGRRVVNGGLWIGDPDIDAITRMALRPNVYGYETRCPRHVLDMDTKCPFNSQNTALHRDVIPAYCLATGLGRYDDIIASYVVKRIADHLEDFISFGTPIVNQKRNEHDLWKDLEDERIGMQTIDQFVVWLYAIELTKTTYKECTAELMLALGGKVSNTPMPDEHYAFYKSIFINYSHWLRII